MDLYHAERTQYFYLLVGFVEDVSRQLLSIKHLVYTLCANLQFFSKHDSQENRIAGILKKVLHATDIDIFDSLCSEEGVDVLVEEVLDA